MKIYQIACTYVLAAVALLGLVGCGLVAPQSTTESYAPSDGVEVDIAGVKLRNLMFVTDESGDTINPVFVGINPGEQTALMRITLVYGTVTDSTDFELVPGSSSYGQLTVDQMQRTLSLPGISAGETVETYIEVFDGDSATLRVPVLDGTLAEYADYVPSPERALDHRAR